MSQPGADHTAGFETVEHRVPMLSLEKLSPNRRDSNGEPMPVSDQLVGLVPAAEERSSKSRRSR